MPPSFPATQLEDMPASSGLPGGLSVNLLFPPPSMGTHCRWVWVLVCQVGLLGCLWHDALPMPVATEPAFSVWLSGAPGMLNKALTPEVWVGWVGMGGQRVEHTQQLPTQMR